jgi:NADPH:quinone reductase-like Zn-dependent oxidoreductase
VVATTSSSAKADRLRELGADHVINYKETPAWGEAAKKLTPKERGFDHIIEVGGPGTLNQTVKAISRQGVISIIGFIAPGENGGQGLPTMMDALSIGCVVRGIFVSNRLMFEDLVQAINANGIKPVVDKVFEMEKAEEAYAHMEGQNHFGKVVIEL